MDVHRQNGAREGKTKISKIDQYLSGIGKEERWRKPYNQTIQKKLAGQNL